MPSKSTFELLPIRPGVTRKCNYMGRCMRLVTPRQWSYLVKVNNLQCAWCYVVATPPPPPPPRPLFNLGKHHYMGCGAIQVEGLVARGGSLSVALFRCWHTM